MWVEGVCLYYYRGLSSAFGRSGRIFVWKQLDLADSSAEQLTEYS